MSHPSPSLARVAACAAALIWAVACGSSPAGPSASSSGGSSLTGTWSGEATDSSGPGTMTWSLTDAGGPVRGPATVSTPLRSVVLTGTVSGTLNGSTLTWSIDVPAGGVAGQPACTVTVSGTATLNGARTGLTGSYAGSGSCTPAFSGGTLTLTRQ